MKLTKTTHLSVMSLYSLAPMATIEQPRNTASRKNNVSDRFFILKDENFMIKDAINSKLQDRS